MRACSFGVLSSIRSWSTRLIPRSAEPPVLARPLAEHSAAVESFLRTASAIPAEQWKLAPGPGKWSPAEVAEHVRLSFDVLLAELREEGRGMRVLLPVWKRVPLRWLLVPRIIRTGQFPKGARAPKEVRPVVSSASQADALARVDAAATELRDACARISRPHFRRLTHAYFGAIPLPTVLRFFARHTQHHEKQLVARADPR